MSLAEKVKDCFFILSYLKILGPPPKGGLLLGVMNRTVFSDIYLSQLNPLGYARTPASQ